MNKRNRPETFKEKLIRQIGQSSTYEEVNIIWEGLNIEAEHFVELSDLCQDKIAEIQEYHAECRAGN